MPESDRDAFWAIMDECVAGAASVDEIYERVLATLGDRPLDDIVSFDRGLSFALYEADTPAMRQAAAMIVQGCEDDSFFDFRCWLVCWLGRTDFYAVVADPDLLAGLIPEQEWPMYVEFGGVAEAAYEQATEGGSIEDVQQPWPIPSRPPGVNAGGGTRVFPRLAQRFPKPM